MGFELESQQQKVKPNMATANNAKAEGVFGDVCALTVLLPKGLELDNFDNPASVLPPPSDSLPRLDLPFRLPDIGLAIRNITKTREVGEFLSGALAGAMSKAVLAPLETIRTRMVVGVGSKNISGSFIQVVEEQGWQGLWAGNAINMLRIVPTQAIELGTFECVKRTVTAAQEKAKQSESPRLQIGSFRLNFSLSCISPVAVAGAAAGIASTLVCHPLEVLKDRLTVSPDLYPNLTIAISRIYKDGGIGAFYSGLKPTLIGMLPYSTCYYFMYDTVKTKYCKSKNKKSLSRPEMLGLGAVAGLTASTISFPLEVARKRLMVGALKGKCPPNMAAALAEVIREEGLLGMYRGWGASCLKVMPNSGITWVFYEAWKDILLGEKRLL
ncbi:Probable mitochondrial adenine nucleotide transporter BTL1 [Linum grandiflorum]